MEPFLDLPWGFTHVYNTWWRLAIEVLTKFCLLIFPTAAETPISRQQSSHHKFGAQWDPFWVLRSLYNINLEINTLDVLGYDQHGSV